MSSSAEPPKIEYPVLYTFRAIGRRDDGFRERVRLSVQSVVGAVADDAVSERLANGGAWVAIHVTCLLQNEEDRIAVYVKLKADPAVVLTL